MGRTPEPDNFVYGTLKLSQNLNCSLLDPHFRKCEKFFVTSLVQKKSILLPAEITINESWILNDLLPTYIIQ